MLDKRLRNKGSATEPQKLLHHPYDFFMFYPRNTRTPDSLSPLTGKRKRERQGVPVSSFAVRAHVGRCHTPGFRPEIQDALNLAVAGHLMTTVLQVDEKKETPLDARGQKTSSLWYLLSRLEFDGICTFQGKQTTHAWKKNSRRT